MADATRLAEQLEAFDHAIERHLQLLDDDFRDLRGSWEALHECYEGTGAERFEDVWTGTLRRFEEYMQRSETLRSVLRERLEALRRFDQINL